MRSPFGDLESDGASNLHQVTRIGSSSRTLPHREALDIITKEQVGGIECVSGKRSQRREQLNCRPEVDVDLRVFEGELDNLANDVVRTRSPNSGSSRVATSSSPHTGPRPSTIPSVWHC